MTDSKTQRLRQSGTLNPNPERISDPLFVEGGFFDPHDLLQVRYEMVRRAEEAPLRETAERFGVRVHPRGPEKAIARARRGPAQRK